MAANNRIRRYIQYVEHTEGDGGEMFKAVCKLGLEGIVSKKLDAPYSSGPSKTWIKIKNPKAPAATGVNPCVILHTTVRGCRAECLATPARPLAHALSRRAACDDWLSNR
jgi:ATP-dependent DNA ligase